MNKILISISCSILLCSCFKDPINLKGSWTLGDCSSCSTSTTYHINYTGRKDSAGYFILYGSDGFNSSSVNSSNVIDIFFPSMPTQNGNYKVVDFNRNRVLDKNQIGVVSIIPARGLYVDAGVRINSGSVPADSARVYIVNGKIDVLLPHALSSISNVGIDSVYLDGEVREN